MAIPPGPSPNGRGLRRHSLQIYMLPSPIGRGWGGLCWSAGVLRCTMIVCWCTNQRHANQLIKSQRCTWCTFFPVFLISPYSLDAGKDRDKKSPNSPKERVGGSFYLQVYILPSPPREGSGVGLAGEVGGGAGGAFYSSSIFRALLVRKGFIFSIEMENVGVPAA